MQDYRLNEQLRKIAPDLLEILKNAGADIERYEPLAEELQRKEEEKKAKQREHKERTAEEKEEARLKRLKRAEERAAEEERDKEYKNAVEVAKRVNLLNDIRELAAFMEKSRVTQEKARQIRLLTDINKAGKVLSSYRMSKERKEQKKAEEERQRLETLKKICNIAGVKMENFWIKETKRVFMDYYAKNWFFLLLELIDTEDLLFCKKHSSTRSVVRRKV